MNNDPLKNLVEIIETGSRDEVKEAQKKVEKFWHEVYIPNREEGRKAFLIFLKEIKKFDKIQDIDHQAYFINTLKWPFYAIGEEYFEEWAEFILKCIQHSSGKIRQAILRATDNLIMEIMIDLRFNSNKKVSQTERKRIEKNKNRFYHFTSTVEELLEKYHEPKFDRYEYISSLPPSIYKSLQKLMVEVLLRNEYYEDLYYQLRSSKTKTSESVLVEEKLQRLLEKYKLSGKLTLKTIKDWIWNDEGDSAMDASNRFQKKWFKYFGHIKNIDELNKISQVFTDAWNYFPHKSLQGRSPNQMVQRELRENPELRKKNNQKMPNFIVGGQKIPWDEYWAMVKKVEKLQTPFKNWVENDLLQKYEEFLKEKWKTKTVKKHTEVAHIFFRRVMWLGFIEFDEIKKDFIQKEFPKWWQTHVLMSSLSEKEVLSSLRKLFQFISSTYNKDIKKFGF